MNKIFYLDLEGTLIDSFFEKQLINVDVVRWFINFHRIKEVNVFSAAIWDDIDLLEFNVKIKDFIESEFGVTVVSCPTMEEVCKITPNLQSICFDYVSEVISLLGKKRMFEDWCFRKKEPNTHHVLIDDSFGNTTLIDYDLNIIVETIDVLKIWKTKWASGEIGETHQT